MLNGLHGLLQVEGLTACLARTRRMSFKTDSWRVVSAPAVLATTMALSMAASMALMHILLRTCLFGFNVVVSEALDSLYLLEKYHTYCRTVLPISDYIIQCKTAGVLRSGDPRASPDVSHESGVLAVHNVALAVICIVIDL